MGKGQWVSPRGDKWAVHGAGNERNTKLFDTQKQAQDYAIKIAKPKERSYRTRQRRKNTLQRQLWQ